MQSKSTTSPSNREMFVHALEALGCKDFDAFEVYLDENLLSEWPYAVMEGFPTEVVGARRLRTMLETSMATFSSYAYRIIEIHELIDPNRLIVEYSSHSTYLPRGTPYSNRYISVVFFHDGKIVRWREYLNPKVIIDALGADFVWEEAQGASRKSV
jgi:ketosteroid isomerase-like protein